MTSSDQAAATHDGSQQAVAPRSAVAPNRLARLLLGVEGQVRRFNLPIGVLLIAVLTLYFANSLGSANGYVLNSVLLAAMGAVALHVLMGVAGQVSIGNAAFLGVGGFVAVWATRAGVPFPVDIVLAAVAAGVAGLIVGLPALRLRGLYLALATLAAHFIVTYIGNLYQNKTNEVSGFLVPTLFNSSTLEDAQKYWSYTLGGLLILVVLGAAAYTRGKTGRALRMIRDHEVTSAMLGINVVRYKLLTFMLTSMVIGVEGALMGHLTGSVSVDNFTLTVAIQYLAMILIGGLDSMVGAVIGATLVIALPVIVPAWLGGVLGNEASSKGPQIAQIIYGALVVLFIVASPGGIMGWLRARQAQLWRWALSKRGAPASDAAQ